MFRLGTVNFFHVSPLTQSLIIFLVLVLMLASSRFTRTTQQRKHKRKRKKKERFPFSCACACVVPVHTYVFLRLCLCLRRCVVASYVWTSLKVLFSWPCEVIMNLRITNRGCLAVFYEIVMVCNLMMQYTGMITYYACTNKSNHLQSGTKVLRKFLKTGLLLANWLFV